MNIWSTQFNQEVSRFLPYGASTEGARGFFLSAFAFVFFWVFVPVPWISLFIKVLITLFASILVAIIVGKNFAKDETDEKEARREARRKMLKAERDKQLLEFQKKQRGAGNV